jgi:hypothetical protein
MLGIWRYHCTVSAASGVVGRACSMPVCSAVGMSLLAIATGWKPCCFHQLFISSSPAKENIFVVFTWSTLTSGLALNR